MFFPWFLVALGIALVVGFVSLVIRSRRDLGRLSGGRIIYLDAALALAALVVVIALLMEEGRGRPPGEAKALAPTTEKPASTLGPSPSPVPSPSPTPPAPTSTSTPSPTVYIVKPGDTLVKVAQDFGLTLEELRGANPTANPETLQVGQELVIPSPKSPPELTATALAASPTPTFTPSPTRVPPSPARTPPPIAALPTSPPGTPTPTPFPYPAPVLVKPENGFKVGLNQPFELEWRWEGQLAEDEHFDVQYWRDGEEPRGRAWEKLKTPGIGRHSIALKDSPGTYYWRVTVIRGKNGQWQANLSAPSERRTIIVVE